MIDPDETRARLRSARLYLLATHGIAADAGHDVTAAVEAALAGGVDVVQLREKHGPDEAWLPLASALAALCRRHGALLIVNDRLALARDCGADGVHLGQDDASVATARATLAAGALVGVSTHDRAELDHALRDGADYVGVGSIYPTTTKGRAVPVGGAAALAPLAAAAEARGVPAFGIGGIDARRVDEVAVAGFRRIAVCAAVLGAADPHAAAAALRSRLNRR